MFRRPTSNLEGPCAKCGLDASLSWMTRVQAYLCTTCWRTVIGLDAHLGGVR
jgi:hypothetical protein